MGNLFIDGSKLAYHPERVKEWLKGEQIYPIHSEISPSSGCNQKCILCCVDFKKHKAKNLSKELMLRLVNDFIKVGVKSFLLAGEGEPLVNKYCVDMLEKVREKKDGGERVDAALNTNGVLFTPKIADRVLDSLLWVRFSIQAPEKKLYAFIHHTPESDYYKTLENISHSVKLKKEKNLEVKLGIQQILINENVNYVFEEAKLSKDMGVDYFTIKRFSKHPSNKYDVQEDLWKKAIPQFKEAEKLSDKNFKVLIRWNQFENQPRTYKKCVGLPFITQILADGGIYPCCQFFGDKEFCYGNLYEKSLKEILDSERARNIIGFIRDKYDISKCITYCRHHSTNLFLTQLDNKSENIPQKPSKLIEHVNFI